MLIPQEPRSAAAVPLLEPLLSDGGRVRRSAQSQAGWRTPVRQSQDLKLLLVALHHLPARYTDETRGMRADGWGRSKALLTARERARRA